jgi:acyl-coenzyme A synthetase/AMP-(fatty) acid ligase
MTASGDLELEVGDQAPVVVRGALSVTRGELRAQSDVLLESLRKRSIGRVLVRSDDPVRILRALDASQRAGSDLWVTHTNLPPEIVEQIVAKFGIQAVLGEGDEFRSDGGEGAAPAARVHMMTSGTTGSPKIAVHTLAGLLAKVRAGANVPANREGKWLLTYQPTGFAGMQVMLTAVLSRGVIVDPEQRTPAGFYEAARRAGVTQISATPTFWRSFLMVVPSGGLALRQITLGGEAIDQPTLDRVRRAFPDARITHIYASTEAGVVFAVHDGLEGFPREWLDRRNQGVELRIRNGLLEIKTPNAMGRYVSDTEQPLLDDGWLATADRCEVEGERVRILGRQDSTINVGGSKVYPLAVETFLLGLPEVQEARVFGLKNPISGFLVAAEVVLAPGVDPERARVDILAACRERLAGYQVPRAFKIVDKIAVAASGKKG